MKRLDKLAIKNGTDKGSNFEDSHNYASFYEPYFEKYERPAILELGTYHGGSTRMFNDYYDGDCEIYTVDITASAYDYVSDMSNVHFFLEDISTYEGVERLCEQLKGIKFDIILDDASHVSEQQFCCLYGLNKLLKEDGIYIIEDIHFSRIWDQNPIETPLYFVTFLNEVPFYSHDKYKELKNKIQDVILYSHKNESTEDMKYYWGGRSMTALLTFNNNVQN